LWHAHQEMCHSVLGCSLVQRQCIKISTGYSGDHWLSLAIAAFLHT